MSDDLQTLVAERRFDEVIARSADLLARIDVDSGRDGWLDVFRVVFNAAVALSRANGGDAALEVIELLRATFAVADDPDARAILGTAVSLEGEIRDRRGDFNAAIASFDESLSLMSDSPLMARSGGVANSLLLKSSVLGKLGRGDEQLVVLDSVFTAVATADRQKAVSRARAAAKATLFKLDVCVTLARYEEALGLGKSLAAALADLPAGEVAALADAEPGSQTALAAALAEITNDDDCWEDFAGTRRMAQSDAENRAMRLYRVSDPWALPSSDGPVDVAAAMVREVADGYALLSMSASETEHKDLPLPKRGGPEREQALRRFGVDQWADEQGHSLRLRTSPTDDEPSEPASATERPGWDNVEPSFIRGAMRFLLEVEIADVLCRSAGGRATLHDELLKVIAENELLLARRWLSQLLPLGESDPRVGLMITFRMFARGLFTATHSASEDAAAGLVTIPDLRALMHDTGAHNWLNERNLPLPDWTA